MMSIGRRITTAALCALLTASPLVGCASTAQKADNDAAKLEEMYKELEQQTEFRGKKVPYSRQGTYTLTFGEGDLLPFGQDPMASADANSADANASNAEANANNADASNGEMGTEGGAAQQQNEKAAADAKAELESAKAARDEAQRALEAAAEAERNAASQAQTEAMTPEQPAAAAADAEMQAEGANTNATTNANAASANANADAANKAAEARKQAEESLAKAEETVKAAEQKVAELEAGKADAAQPAAEQPAAAAQEGKAEKKAFADVKLEDVKVRYAVMTNRAEVEADESGATEPKYEDREAQVVALSNADGSITLSFTDPDAASNAADGSYSVEIESLGKYLPVLAESASPQLSAESNVKTDSESCDVTVKAEGDKFAAGLSAADLKLGGSFADMQITGAEASGDTLTVHLSGRPKMDRDAASIVTDGQIVVPASGFENSQDGATALVDVGLPDEAFDMGGAEVLPTAAADAQAEYSTIEGDTGRATIHITAGLGELKDVKAEGITLGDAFADGKVESVTKEAEGGSYKVELTFPANGQKADDYVLAGTVKLAAGSMDDAYGNAAPEVEAVVTVASGEAMGKDEAADKKKEEDKKKREESSKKIKNMGDTVKYTKEYLKNVDPVLGDVADFTAEALDMAANIAAGNYSKVVTNVLGLLKICGAIPSQKETTAADVMKEVQELREVVEAIKVDVKDVKVEAQADRYTQTATRLKSLQHDCENMAAKYEMASKILATRKDNPMKAPGAGASKEEYTRYKKALNQVMSQEWDKQMRGKVEGGGFKDLNTTMTDIKKNLTELVQWASIDKDAVNASVHPIDICDKLISYKVNWDSQGYYARAAYRAEMQYTILAAWACFCSYYDLDDAQVAKGYRGLADDVAKSLRQIAARPAGMSPEKVRELNLAGKDVKVYSPTLGITVKRARLITKGGMEIGLKNIQDIPEKKIDEYIGRIRSADGRNKFHDDLELAGLDVQDGSKHLNVGFLHRESHGTYNNSSARYYGDPNYYETTYTYLRNGMVPTAKTTVDGYTTTYRLGRKGSKVYRNEYLKVPFVWFDRA